MPRHEARFLSRVRHQHQFAVRFAIFEQLVCPDEIHDFLLWRSWVRAYTAEADFFDRTLKRGEMIVGQ